MSDSELLLRRPPKQDRSRDRVDEILEAVSFIQADKELSKIDRRETERQADFFCDVARPFIEEDRFGALRLMAFLMFQFVNGQCAWP